MFMPGFIGAIGGQKEKCDLNSRDTALREVEEETGLLCNDKFWKNNYKLLGPKKFTEGKNVDWFYITIPSSFSNDSELNWFTKYIKSKNECSNTSHITNLFRPYNTEIPILWHVPFGHCWVEKGGKCIDKSNGNNIKFPKQLYYALLKAPVKGTKLFKYTPEQVSINVLKHKHWGPWDLKPPR